MSFNTQALPLTQPIDSTQRPPLGRTGSRPGSRKARIIYPSDGTVKAQESNNNSHNVIIKLNNTTLDQSLEDDISRRNKENHPAFRSPMSLPLSQSCFTSHIRKSEYINKSNQGDLSNQDTNINRIELAKDGKRRGLQTQEAASMSYNMNNLMPSTAVCVSSVSEDKSLGEHFTEETKSVIVEGSQMELNKSMDLPNQTSEVKKKVPKWKTLKSVFHSLLLFNREEVKNINDMKAISQEVNEFELRKQPNNSSSVLQPVKDNFTQDALNRIRTVNILCECASIGSPKDLDKMRKILQSDPKRYLWAPEDAEHIINTHNSQGQNPMYIAAKNGNLEVVRLLVESRANHQLRSKAQSNDGIGETPLEVAIRWGHLTIVDYLLQNGKHDVQRLMKIAAGIQNRALKKSIMDYIKQHKNKRHFSFFVCGKY